ncbi:MAG: hypothetical protein MUE46_11415 [Xanthomonadales bacterium]|nr:hypothetical protein [Xanthomonadales bacterium]
MIDNLESVLSPPFADRSPAAEGTSAALTADEQERAAAILALAARLGEAGHTRILFTSREALPAPFNGSAQRIELQRLSRADAVQLVERSLGLDAGGKGLEAEAQREQIESLVEAVHGHARTLALLAPTLKARGAAATQAELTQLMVQMEQRFPGQREHSLLASVELLELSNLMALLAAVEGVGDAEMTIDLTTQLYGLLQKLNRPWLIERIAQARDAALHRLGDQVWGHVQFEAERTRIEQLLAAGRVREALAAAQGLHQRALTAGEVAYADADYDLAGACFFLGRVLRFAGQAGAALPLLAEARRRYDAVEAREPGCGAARMAAVAIAEQGHCLTDLGRLDEAAQAYETAIALAEQRGGQREVAVGKGQLGTVRLRQQRYAEALIA